MNQAILFKSLQRQLKFRNPQDVLVSPPLEKFQPDELESSSRYIDDLHLRSVRYAYPGHVDYPIAFYRMKEPPLFFEYFGEPAWKTTPILSVVGSRKIQSLTQSWMRAELSKTLKALPMSICSGGAIGVDMMAHSVSLLENRPTIAVMPSGLGQIYPKQFAGMVSGIVAGGGAVISEFEFGTVPHKSHFFHRNRLIAAFGCVTLVAQAAIKSGTMLTVHHCLQNGRVVVTIPAHPESQDFSGNLQIIEDGGLMVTNATRLIEVMRFESKSYAGPHPTPSDEFVIQPH